MRCMCYSDARINDITGKVS